MQYNYLNLNILLERNYLYFLNIYYEYLNIYDKFP